MFKATIETATKLERQDFAVALQAKEWVHSRMAEVGSILHGRVVSEDRKSCLLWCRVRQEAFGYVYEAADAE